MPVNKLGLELSRSYKLRADEQLPAMETEGCGGEGKELPGPARPVITGGNRRRGSDRVHRLSSVLPPGAEPGAGRVQLCLPRREKAQVISLF